MLDPLFVRDHLDVVDAALRRRGLDPSKDSAAAALESERCRIRRRELEARAEPVGRSGRAREEGRARPERDLCREQSARRQDQGARTELAEVEQKRDALLLTLPNLPHESVPTGQSSADNREERRWGQPRALTLRRSRIGTRGRARHSGFRTGRAHVGRALSVLAQRRRTFVSCAHQFRARLHARDHGYREVEPPFPGRSRGADRAPAICRSSSRTCSSRRGVGPVPDSDRRSPADEPPPAEISSNGNYSRLGLRRTRRASAAKPARLPRRRARLMPAAPVRQG